ncbi:MAG: helix-turn-helix domain-containing protein [Clostridia bacterium]|nr:helix-turn-helix domain-containing protein [Clostridia bacterium]
MRSNDCNSLTLKVQIGDLELYTAPDMGFVGSFAVTPKIHSHPYYEVIAVIEGELKIRLLDNRVIALGKGKLCVIPPKCYHSTCAGDIMPKMLAIRFSYGKVHGEARVYDEFCSVLERVTEPTCLETPENIPSTLLELRREMQERRPAWAFVCQSLLQRIYLGIFRLLSTDKESRIGYTADDSKHSRYYHIEMWFADNFAKQITEDDLAREMSLSKRQLSRVFTNIYGMSFREKLVEVRLHRAAQLLEQTDLNIDKIALTVGYRSFSGFHRAFVNYFGCTPFEYRKNRED